MSIVRLGPVVLGDGTTKILVPIVADSREAVLRDARALEGHGADIVEWRIDHLSSPELGDSPLSADLAISIGRELREALRGTPLLATFRTGREGGERDLSDAQYADLLVALAQSGVAEAIDVEAFRGKGHVSRVIAAAHDASVKVVASNHDFHATPPKDEIVRRLRFMHNDLDADIAKIAVMPKDPGDVLTLLGATWEMTCRYASRPVITMSMGDVGVISRLAGATFGSAATFGSVGAASAPGQIDADRLRGFIDLIDGAHSAAGENSGRTQ